MTDLKLNELPVDAEGDFANIPHDRLTETQKAELLKRNRAGLSPNETIAAGPNHSVGARGTDTSGVESGTGAGAGLTFTTPGAPGESPAPEIIPGARGTGTTPRIDSDTE